MTSSFDITRFHSNGTPLLHLEKIDPMRTEQLVEFATGELAEWRRFYNRQWFQTGDGGVVVLTRRRD